jgi:hypothetical protein
MVAWGMFAGATRNVFSTEDLNVDRDAWKQQRRRRQLHKGETIMTGRLTGDATVSG